MSFINGRAYDWSQVVVSMSNGSRPFAGISSVSYSDEQEIETNYGAGNLPVSYGMGRVKCEGSITLHMEELELIAAATVSGRIQDIPAFDLVVSFLNPDGKLATHVVKNCKFTKNSRELNANDKMFEVEVPFICSHIEWNKVAIGALS